MDFNCFNFFESKSAFNVLVSEVNLHLYTTGDMTRIAVKGAQSFPSWFKEHYMAHYDMW